MTQQIEPCPNCGGACRPCPSKSPWSSKWVECGNTACQYRGPISLVMDAENDGAIALHNRIARAVREASELSHLAGHYLTRAEKAEAERDDFRLSLGSTQRRAAGLAADMAALRRKIKQHNREWPEAQIDMPEDAL